MGRGVPATDWQELIEMVIPRYKCWSVSHFKLLPWGYLLAETCIFGRVSKIGSGNLRDVETMSDSCLLWPIGILGPPKNSCIQLEHHVSKLQKAQGSAVL